MSKLNQGELLEVLEQLKRDSCELLQWNEKNMQAYQQIKEMIKKPQVTEEWIEEKAEKYKDNVSYHPAGWIEYEIEPKDFIRSLVEEIK